MALDSDMLGVTPQPPPTDCEHSEGVTVQMLKVLRAHGIGADNPIAEDYLLRREAATKKYGTELMTFNGRDSEVDAYQELLDALLYYTQFRMEREKIGEADFTISTLQDQIVDVLVTLRGSITARNAPEPPKIIL